MEMDFKKKTIRDFEEMNFQERTKMDCKEMDFQEKWIVRKQILRKKH